MTGNKRGALRSSARLNGGGGSSSAAATSAASAARAAARSAEAAAAAARRRARAAERAKEVEDSPRELRDKCRRLAQALRNAKHLVVYTGAGISTAADIPDYRGPRGVWTRLRRGETVGRVEVSRAQPTLTHMALTALWARGTLKFVVSQNCDGLHVRAGLPRRALAELHGDMFAERCGSCRRVYLRAFDTTERTARHAHGTRRLCHKCGAELSDTIVHFGERGRAAWPLNWAGALRHAAAADVVLCLGSSLKVLRRYPRLWRMQCAPHARPALYIVNLQWTPKDAVAKLKINARCDAVMEQVARRLRLRVPRYSPRRDPLLAHAVPLAPQEAHTTRRPVLSPPSSCPSRSQSDSESEDTLSPSDSDDELPLLHLAKRIRGQSPPKPLPPPQPPPLKSPMLRRLDSPRLRNPDTPLSRKSEGVQTLPRRPQCRLPNSSQSDRLRNSPRLRNSERRLSNSPSLTDRPCLRQRNRECRFSNSPTSSQTPLTQRKIDNRFHSPRFSDRPSPQPRVLQFPMTPTHRKPENHSSNSNRFAEYRLSQRSWLSERRALRRRLSENKGTDPPRAAKCRKSSSISEGQQSTLLPESIPSPMRENPLSSRLPGNSLRLQDSSPSRLSSDPDSNPRLMENSQPSSRLQDSLGLSENPMSPPPRLRSPLSSAPSMLKNGLSPPPPLVENSMLQKPGNPAPQSQRNRKENTLKKNSTTSPPQISGNVMSSPGQRNPVYSLIPGESMSSSLHLTENHKSQQLIENSMLPPPPLTRNPMSQSPRIIRNPMSPTPGLMENPMLPQLAGNSSPQLQTSGNTESSSPRIIRNPMSPPPRSLKNPSIPPWRLAGNTMSSPSPQILANPMPPHFIRNPVSPSPRLSGNSSSAQLLTESASSTMSVSRENPESTSPRLQEKSTSTSPQLPGNSTFSNSRLKECHEAILSQGTESGQADTSIKQCQKSLSHQVLECQMSGVDASSSNVTSPTNVNSVPNVTVSSNMTSHLNTTSISNGTVSANVSTPDVTSPSNTPSKMHSPQNATSPRNVMSSQNNCLSNMTSLSSVASLSNETITPNITSPTNVASPNTPPKVNQLPNATLPPNVKSPPSVTSFPNTPPKVNQSPNAIPTSSVTSLLNTQPKAIPPANVIPPSNVKPQPSVTLQPNVTSPPNTPPKVNQPADAAVSSKLTSPAKPPPDLLHAFQVNMRTGDATILLRAHHAPSVQSAAATAPRRPISDLRLFRIARRAPPPVATPINGHASPHVGNGTWPLAARLRHLLQAPPMPPRLFPTPLSLPGGAQLTPNGQIKTEPDIKREKIHENGIKTCLPLARTNTTENHIETDSKLQIVNNIKPKIDSENDEKPLNRHKCNVKVENVTETSDELERDRKVGAEASALAAAFIARALLLCRGSLYSGLHTILAPKSSPQPKKEEITDAECEWCVKHYSMRRCQFYGPPPSDVSASRVWRRVRGKRYLCACCGDDDVTPAELQDQDGGGWYGKGYRKGRRRRR